MIGAGAAREASIRASQSTGTPRRCDAIGNWHAITIDAAQHKRIRDEIAHQGYVPYVPLVTVTRRSGRVSQRREQPMLGPYAFVHGPLEPAFWRIIATTHGVQRFIAYPDGRPKLISDDAINIVRMVEAVEANRSHIAASRSGAVWHFAPGDVARIVEGPFAGFQAQLMAAVDERGRIKVIIDMLGRVVPIELSAFDIDQPLK